MRAWHARWQLTQLSSRSAAGLRWRVSRGQASAVCAHAQHQTGTQEPVELRVRPADLRGSKAKLRLDAYLTEQLPQASRAKLQASIRSGLVLVNGAVQQKTSHSVRPGDAVLCTLVQPQLTSAIPEALPLDIVYEDDVCLVVNKAAGMVMHPAPGNMTGTLVNALLHYYNLPPVELPGEGQADWVESTTSGDLDEGTDEEDAQAVAVLLPGAGLGALRPGIVHRLDKGTTGLVVVAKTEAALATLSAQFKARTVMRTYLSITLGCPREEVGQVRTNVGRHFKERKKMGIYEYGGSRGRTAVSNYKVLRPLAGGSAALVQWRLETGRTHQIRVHAKHLGHPLFCDEAYSGAKSSAVNAIGRGKSLRQATVHRLLKSLDRPALHASTLGFAHPTTAELLKFDSTLPDDFNQVLDELTSLE